jgi:hypothetical protein
MDEPQAMIWCRGIAERVHAENFNEWTCISQNFSDRRARAAKERARGDPAWP